MNILKTQMNPKSAVFKANARAMTALVKELQEKLAHIQGGGERLAQERHQQHGKLLPRQRLQRLIDENSDFLELSALAGQELYGTDLAAGGLISGIGRVMGLECMIVINDATVKGG